LASQTYEISLVDAGGWASKRPSRFALKMKPDRDPVIKTRLVGITSMIVPGARVPVDCQISDDFAISLAQLAWHWRGDGTDQTGSSGQLPFDELKDKYGAAKIGYKYTFETGPLGLQAGAALGFHVEARDNDTVSGPKTGKSG